VYPSNTLAYNGISNFDFVAIPDFMAGLMYGFTGKNHLDEMHTCMGESKVVLTGAKQILADAEAGHMIKAAKGAKALVSNLKKEVAGCKNMSEEMKAIEAWAEIFAEPKSLFKTMGANYLKNNRNIKNDIANEKADWAAGAYFHSGIDVADLLVQFFGEVQPLPALIPAAAVANVSCTTAQWTLMAPDFIAGMIYGFTGDNELTEIEACYTGG